MEEMQYSRITILTVMGNCWQELLQDLHQESTPALFCVECMHEVAYTTCHLVAIVNLDNVFPQAQQEAKKLLAGL